MTDHPTALSCEEIGRTLVVDLYAAEVMELLAEHGRLPQPDWRGVSPARFRGCIGGPIARSWSRDGA